MACRCPPQVCRCGATPWTPGCPPGGPSPTQPIAPGTGQPVSSLACTVLGSLQSVVDNARRIAHTIGARPYRVFLVWQQQEQFAGKWEPAYELELMPVLLEPGRESLETTAAGQVPAGTITLSEVSPQYVDELTLRGYISGAPWSQDEPTREFFYEVRQLPRCTGDEPTERYRYVLAGVPELVTSAFEWRIKLTAQFGRRDRNGQDATVSGDLFDGEDAVLVP